MQTNKQTILCKLHQNTNKTGKCIQTFYEAHLILIPKQESRIKENVRSMYIISMDAKKFESLSVSKDILLWWVMLSIFSCICWPSACLLWKNVYSGPVPIFNWILDYLFCLVLSCRSSSCILDTNQGNANQNH